MPTREELLTSAQKLHTHLVQTHYQGGLLHGPDPGVRFNLRVWRFLKAALKFVPWKDDYVFTQTQGYWVLGNWMLYEATGDRRCRDIAIESTDATLALETAEGYWEYPLPERKHLIATLEGIWGASPLLATYEREPRPEFLEGAIRAHDFIVNRIGFQDHPQGEVINYFDRPRGKVPNNSVIAAWFFLRLWKTTQDSRYLDHVQGLLDFVKAVQLPSGEIPYIVDGPYEKGREHYLCFQYNAYQFLHLAWSNRIKPGDWAKSVLPSLARFLEKGVQPTGACANNCASARGGGPEVDYYTVALGAALHEAVELGVGISPEFSERCYARALARQRPDGSFGFSTGDYGFLRDQRSYPRQQAMTLFHLLYPICGDGFSKTVNG